MPRIFSDWLPAFVRYASVTEAPQRMHLWCGITAIAGALRRHVWLDMERFTWTPNFYTVLVAPPGIVGKSSTADIAMNLLKQVPGIKFGANAITPQAIPPEFAAASEAFEYAGEFLPMAPITFVASELGSLINLQDRDMVNLLIELWDGRVDYKKVTKTSGRDTLEMPWINILACTTPHWIADNMPASMIGGGLSSRCIFLYADEKDKYVPFVDEMIPNKQQDLEFRHQLITDLEHIATQIIGPFRISPEARDWFRPVYVEFWKAAKQGMDQIALEGYAARWQTHLFKTAMVLSVSHSDARLIALEDLLLAYELLKEIETEMHKVFARIGQSEEARQAERLVQHIRRAGTIPFEDAYRVVHGFFPDCRDFEGILVGLIRSGQIEQVSTAQGLKLKARGV